MAGTANAVLLDVVVLVLLQENSRTEAAIRLRSLSFIFQRFNEEIEGFIQPHCPKLAASFIIFLQLPLNKNGSLSCRLFIEF